MSAMTSQISGVSIIYTAVCLVQEQRIHQSSPSLAFVWGIHWSPVNSLHKGPVTRKCFHLMTSSCYAVTMTNVGYRSYPDTSNLQKTPHPSPLWTSCGLSYMNIFNVLQGVSTAFVTHYSDVIMGAKASQITSLAIVCLLYRLFRRRSKKNCFVRGIHRGPLNSPHK